MQIAFIGLGNMGLPMALNLRKAGHELVGFDPKVAEAESFPCVGSAHEAAARAEVVLTMLPDGQAVQSVYDQVLPSLGADTLLLDCSTIDVASARALSAQAAASGFAAIDAPVSGGVAGAAQATLTFMVGGEAAAVVRARPLLEVMGNKIVHCGGAGAGQAAKVCNNMLLGVSMLGLCEAFALADRLGLDRQRFFDVAAEASGQCWSLTTYCPAPGVGPSTPADREYQPGFAAELMLKDLRLAQQSAVATHTPARLGALATQIYEEFVQEGGAGQDFSAYLKKIGKPS